MLGVNSIQISQKLLCQIAEIDEFKGLWGGLERHTTGLHLLGDVAEHGAEFEALLGALKDQPLTLEIIQALHKTQGGGDRAGVFKAKDVTLEISGAGGIVGSLETAAPEDAMALLSKLCEWLNASLGKDAQGDLHPALVAAVFTSIFLQISPFEFGNLRLVRFLLILLMLKAGYTYAPYVSLAPIMEARAAEVYNALNANQLSLEAGRPDWSQWLDCFLSVMREQQNVLYARLYGKKEELAHLPKLSEKIMQLFREHERLQMKEIVKLTRGRRATIKLRLTELLEAGYLKRHGQGRATWYSLV